MARFLRCIITSLLYRLRSFPLLAGADVGGTATESLSSSMAVNLICIFFDILVYLMALTHIHTKCFTLST